MRKGIVAELPVLPEGGSAIVQHMAPAGECFLVNNIIGGLAVAAAA